MNVGSNHFKENSCLVLKLFKSIRVSIPQYSTPQFLLKTQDWKQLPFSRFLSIIKIMIHDRGLVTQPADEI